MVLLSSNHTLNNFNKAGLKSPHLERKLVVKLYQTFNFSNRDGTELTYMIAKLCLLTLDVIDFTKKKSDIWLRYPLIYEHVRGNKKGGGVMFFGY